MEDYDITPDQVRLRKNVQTQTEIDMFIMDDVIKIIDNIDKIEKHYRKRKRTLQIRSYLINSLGCLFVLYW